MLILCSNGLSSDNVKHELKKYLSDDNTSAALVITADNIYKAENYHVARCIDELKDLGLHVDIIDIDVSPCEELLKYSVVEFIGGNPFYLLESIRKCRGEDILRIICRNRILIGWSAATFVFGPTLELVYKYSPELNTVGLISMKALALTDVEVLPHYSRYLSRFDRFEERCKEYEKENNKRVIRINDGDAVFIIGDEKKIIRMSKI
ncbi:MAG: type 1 glutamine amidotransferase-like domain-containing protein [Clostridiaceae bacterium]|nr:type 1 glutamine amidotransferase-like domain-containing protein [Clostridiaceae bacterium]